MTTKTAPPRCTCEVDQRPSLARPFGGGRVKCGREMVRLPGDAWSCADSCDVVYEPPNKRVK